MTPMQLDALGNLGFIRATTRNGEQVSVQELIDAHKLILRALASLADCNPELYEDVMDCIEGEKPEPKVDKEKLN